MTPRLPHCLTPLLRALLALLLSLSPLLLFSQTEAVIKNKSTDVLTEPIKSSASSLITVISGGIIRINSGASIIADAGSTVTGFGSGGAWGTITGTLTDQADLAAALALLAPIASPTFTGTVTLPAAVSGAATITLNSGSKLVIANTTTTTASNAGALVVTGGIGVGGRSVINDVKISKGTSSGTGNMSIGPSASGLPGTGSFNTGLGYAALSNSSGAMSYNTAVGAQALQSVAEDHNTAVGAWALQAAAGDDNTAVGSFALPYIFGGDHNTAVGYYAGYFYGPGGGQPITSANRCTFIGSDLRPAANAPLNQIIIGEGATGMADHTTVIGNADTTDTYLEGIVHASSFAGDLTGNADTVTTNADLTGDVTSLGNATTLATVNSDVGSFTNASVTVNAKGQVTAASSGAAPTQSVSIATKTTTFTTTSTSFTDVTDLSITVTTTASSDVVEIGYNIAWSGSGAAESRGARFVRDGNAIFVGTAAGNRFAGLAGTELATSQGSVTNLGGVFFDSPGAAGTYVYKFQVKTTNAGNGVFINQSITDADNIYTVRPASQIWGRRVPQ